MHPAPSRPGPSPTDDDHHQQQPQQQTHDRASRRGSTMATSQPRSVLSPSSRSAHLSPPTLPILMTTTATSSSTPSASAMAAGLEPSPRSHRSTTLNGSATSSYHPHQPPPHYPSRPPQPAREQSASTFYDPTLDHGDGTIAWSRSSLYPKRPSVPPSNACQSSNTRTYFSSPPLTAPRFLSRT